jgi:hypothetical protein
MGLYPETCTLTLKMKNILLFLLVVLQSFHTVGQIDVAWGGQQIASPKNSSIEGIIGGNDTRIFALKVKSKGWGSDSHFFLETYAKKTMGFVSSREFNLPVQTERSNPLARFFLGAGKFQSARLERLFYLNGKFLLFTTFYSSEKEKYYAYVQYISEDGTVDKNVVDIDVMDASSKHNKGKFDFVLSEDKSRILIYRSLPYDKTGNARFSYKVIDENLNVLWSKKLDLPYKDKQFHVSKYRIDNQGNVFMLANIDKNKDLVERRKPTYTYSILAYFYKEDKVKEYTIDLGEKFISDVAFNINSTGDLICTGFYSKSSETSQAGTFYLRIDRSTTEVSARSLHDFEKDFMIEFMSERKVDKGRELYNFDIDHLLLRDDGSAVMVAEQYFMDVVSYYNPATHSYTYSYHYYYNDIIVVGFDPTGQPTLFKKIAKYQHSINDGGPYASYVLVDGGQILHFIYNDHADNIHRTESEIEHGHISNMNYPGRSVVVMVSMDMKGNTQRTQLMDNHSRKANCWFMPKMNKRLDDKTVVLFSKRGKYYRFGRVSF